MGKEKFNLEKTLKAIESNGGFVSDTARALGVTRITIWAWRKKYKSVEQAFEDVEEAHLDLCESKLIQAVNQGKPWAICFYLKCKGKSRGYVERVEQSVHSKVRVVDSDESNDEIGRAISQMKEETLIHVIKNAKMQYDERYKPQ